MIQVLVADDDTVKTSRIIDAIGIVLGEEVRIQVARNLADAYAALAIAQYDLLILDLNMPRREGEPPRSRSGVEFLRSLSSKHDIRVPTSVVGLTAFDALAMEQESEFADIMSVLLRYDSTTNAWATRLQTLLVRIARAKSEVAEEGYQTDLALVCAVRKVEMDAMLRLEASWKTEAGKGHDVVYHLGEFKRSTSSLSVVGGCIDEMGMVPAAVFTGNLIAQFRPRYLAMIGIAGGVSGGFGDLLIGDQFWDYGAGKVIRDGQQTAFDPAPHTISLDIGVRAQLCSFAATPGLMANVESGWAGPRPATRLAFHVGPMASGAAVVQDADFVAALRKRHRKLVGLDMEAYGVVYAANATTRPRPRVFVVKSISDLADADKSDTYQTYASYTAARFCYEFACEQLM